MRMGWRYFRVKGEDEQLFDNEQVCASEAKGTSCAACGLCAGMSTAKAKSQVITVHGMLAGNF
jgi:dihydroxyacid dehydratase/phosphogluconate dehydratase